MAARLSIVSLASSFRVNYALTRAAVVGGRRGIQGSLHQDQAASAAGEAVDKVKRGADEAMKSGENIKNTAANTAQNISEKAKEVMGGAWGSTKETAEKAKETVMGKTAQTKEAVKSQAAKVEKCMNTKKEVS